MKKEHKELAELLRRDAQSINDCERFDAKLHQDTIRCIRQLEQTDKSHMTSSWRFFGAAGGAVAAAIVFGFLFLHQKDASLTPKSLSQPTPTADVLNAPPVASLLAYRRALADGEDSLLSMLDRDALILLPPSATAFSTNH